MKKLYRLAAVTVSLMPMMAMAAVSTFEGLVQRATSLINTIVPFLLTIVVLLIIWGAVQLSWAKGDTEKAKKAKDMIMYGVIGAVVIVGVWGLISIAESILGLEKGKSVNAPTISF